MLLVGLFFGLSAGSAMAGTITGSAHDFSTSGWVGVGGQICVVCHTPHNSLTAADGATAPLWNHEVTTATFTMYTSASFDGSTTQPTGASKMCLSCHDGTVALDSFGANRPSGGAPLPGTSTRNFGTDLTNDHPISFVYDAALVTADPGLHPTTKAVTIGSGADTKPGTIATVMLEGGDTLQCSSCHDVHNKFAVAGTPLLKVDLTGSALCLVCHNK